MQCKNELRRTNTTTSCINYTREKHFFNDIKIGTLTIFSRDVSYTEGLFLLVIGVNKYRCKISWGVSVWQGGYSQIGQNSMINNIHSICDSLKTAGTVALHSHLSAAQSSAQTILLHWNADTFLHCRHTQG